MIISLMALISGYIIDLIVGDPQGLWHPIIGIGKVIYFFEKVIRKILPKSKSGELVGGIFIVLFVLIVSVGIPGLIIYFTSKVDVRLKYLVETIMSYQILATKSLKKESMKVYYALKTENIDSSRYAVSRIVGRDVNYLNEEGIIKATVETVAENTSDGVIAPMFFLAIGGPILGFAYKAINTMDSMIGYKNEKYMFFGRFAAKLDDIVNYIPARISAMIMIVASFFDGLNVENAFKIYLRDRYNHSSPNSAHTEAVCAGALEIELGGDAYYFGKLVKKKTMGDPIKKIRVEDIVSINRLMYTTSFIGILMVFLELFIVKLIR